MFHFFLFLVLSTSSVWCENTTVASKLFKFMLFILIRQFFLVEPMIPFPVCGNCQELENAHKTTGRLCHFEDGLSIIRIFEGENNTLPACMPPIYDITRMYDS